MGGAVPWGLVVGVSCGWRCPVGIGREAAAWAALCHCDWRLLRVCVGSAVPVRLAGRAFCGRRCAVGIGGDGVVWVALSRWDWRGGRRVGSAVLVGRPSCG